MPSTELLKQAKQVFELPAFPNAKLMLVKAAGTARKKATPETEALRLGARVKDVRFDRDWVRAYNAVCGFEGEEIALTAPQVMAGALHMYLMSRPEHPFAMLGMVHLHNKIELLKPLEYGTRYEVLVTVGDTRSIPQGREFDVLTEFVEGGEVVWKSTMTVLSRVKGMPKPVNKPAPEAGLNPSQAQYTRIKVPENQGRLYAKVSSDYNPIHLYKQTASLFGFKQAIAHGMWTAAKTLSLLQGQLGSAARTFDVSFKQPVFLPSASSIKSVVSDGVARFEVLSERESKVQIVGQITA